MNERVYLPQHNALGTISGRVFRGFPGITVHEEYRISLDDGREVAALPGDMADADNVAVLRHHRPLSVAMRCALASVGRDDDPGPDAA